MRLFIVFKSLKVFGRFTPGFVNQQCVLRGKPHSRPSSPLVPRALQFAPRLLVISRSSASSNCETVTSRHAEYSHPSLYVAPQMHENTLMQCRACMTVCVGICRRLDRSRILIGPVLIPACASTFRSSAGRHNSPMPAVAPGPHGHGTRCYATRHATLGPMFVRMFMQADGRVGDVGVSYVGEVIQLHCPPEGAAMCVGTRMRTRARMYAERRRG